MYAMCKGVGDGLPTGIQAVALMQRHIKLGEMAVNVEPS